MNQGLKESSAADASQLTSTLGVSPVPFQVLRSPVLELSDESRRKLKRKIDQVIEASAKQIAELIAPTQGQQLIDELYHDDPQDNDPQIPVDIQPLLNPYMNSDPQSKLVILMLVDHNNHSKTSIQEYFHCSRYSVDKARSLKKASSGLVIPTKEIFRRNRLNFMKCEHFLEFIFSYGLLQDVAYGV